jgi:hypothetical protein
MTLGCLGVALLLDDAPVSDRLEMAKRHFLAAVVAATGREDHLIQVSAFFFFFFCFAFAKLLLSRLAAETCCGCQCTKHGLCMLLHSLR